MQVVLGFQVWQSSEDALLQMVVVILVQLAAGSKILPGWDALGTGVQLLLVSSTSINKLTFPLDASVCCCNNRFTSLKALMLQT